MVSNAIVEKNESKNNLTFNTKGEKMLRFRKGKELNKVQQTYCKQCFSLTGTSCGEIHEKKEVY
jgi:hypothetical protein